MQGIEFEEDSSFSRLSPRASQIPSGKPSFMLRALKKVGVIDKTTANFILLGVAVIFFGVAIFLYAGIFGDNIPSKQTAEQIADKVRILREMENLK
jgi:hypothetical protein